MFRRHPSPDRDVVATAQRRLAALAEHHTRFSSSGAAARHEEPPEPLQSGEPDAPTASPTRAVAHHVGPRRSELGRWGVNAQQVTVVALLVVGLVVAGAWWALRSMPHAEPVQVSSHRSLPSGPTAAGAGPVGPVAPSPSPSGAAGGPAPTGGSTRLVVDVAGKVRHPGIVELPAGSRVVDAIAAAGGARRGVSLTSLNLARLLVDGEQIVVGVDVPAVGGTAPGASGGPGGGATSPAIAPVDLNTATAEQLDTLPDIGPVTAAAIVQWRAENGSFSSVDDLVEVSGIGAATLADVRPYVYV